MKIEDGFVVIELNEETKQLVMVMDGDEYWTNLRGGRFVQYPPYAFKSRFTGRAGFVIRRPIANCSPELLALAGYTNESIHF